MITAREAAKTPLINLMAIKLRDMNRATNFTRISEHSQYHDNAGLGASQETNRPKIADITH